ncbi:MAG TPA: hypothetical protein VER11_13885 [Polyangiaceae bacterium]|nr:hypothetical protein [Polyangiaceae bacterium]
MSELPDNPRGSRPYLPPPPDDSPESVHVPRIGPPPASLEAMVRSKPGAPLTPERGPTWLWTVLLIVAIGAIAYYLGLKN